jgi:hypothetical protein
MFTVILSDESVSTFSLIYLCKSVSQKVFARFIDALVQVQLFGCGIIITTSPRWLIQSSEAKGVTSTVGEVVKKYWSRAIRHPFDTSSDTGL